MFPSFARKFFSRIFEISQLKNECYPSEMAFDHQKVIDNSLIIQKCKTVGSVHSPQGIAEGIGI